LLAAPAAVGSGAQPSDAPALQWVTTLGGSGTNTSTAVSADSPGNIYIAGNTTSLDFPTIDAAQPRSGGSPVVRINAASGASHKVYFSGLTALGTLQSIAADPENPQSIYASGSGGIFHSPDSGNTWTRLAPIPSGAIVFTIAIDPANSQTLYAGAAPAGAFKSTDGGASWIIINHGVPPAADGTLDIYQIWIDPKSPAVLLASTSTGLLRSANAGGSWTQVLGRASSLAFDPFTAGTIYACGPNLPGIAESTDDGQTWAQIPDLPFSSANAIAADPRHSGTLYVSAGYTGLLQSQDAGKTWTVNFPGSAVSGFLPTTAIVADPSTGVMYANIWPYGILASTDGFTTYTILAPQIVQANQIVVAGANIFVLPAPTTDVFVAKLDANGNTVYATYFGGSANDTAVAMAVGKDGSVYVTGNTDSMDFPVTGGSYNPVFPAVACCPHGGSYLFKLKPDGSLAWSTFFTTSATTVAALAVDDEGSAYLTGNSLFGLPVTAGAYQTTFPPLPSCAEGYALVPICPETGAFLTKFNAGGSGLVFSTYIASDAVNNWITNANTLALAPNGSIYLAGVNPCCLGSTVFLMNGSGSALLGDTFPATGAIDAMALDSSQNVYVTGVAYSDFTGTPGAFQMAPQPAIASLPGGPSSPPQHAFVMKFDSSLSNVLDATLLSGEGSDAGTSIAVDASGNVIAGGNTTSKAFPTLAPFQGDFSGAGGSGFVAGLDPTLSYLLFSTFVGDTRPFNLAGAVPDGSGNILLAGSTSAAAIANKIALPPAPAVRLDSVVNAASRIAGALSPGETIAVLGAGFGLNAQLTINGDPAPVLSQSATGILATVPSDIDTTGALQVKITSGGAVSNAIYMPAAAASPGVFSVSGSGVGQGYILNHDGTPNSPSNPAAMGSAITILATGVGQIAAVGPYAVTNLPVSVYVDGYYADGIAAVVKHVSGLPGPVYEISVFVPSVDQFGSQMPPLVALTMVLGNVDLSNPDLSAFRSQDGIALSVKQ
jgi:uncharacterized protein (TIGR03437 family)